MYLANKLNMKETQLTFWIGKLTLMESARYDLVFTCTDIGFQSWVYRRCHAHTGNSYHSKLTLKTWADKLFGFLCNHVQLSLLLFCFYC